MADMFEKDTAGFTEDYDPGAEPGEIPTDAAPAAEASESADADEADETEEA